MKQLHELKKLKYNNIIISASEKEGEVPAEDLTANYIDYFAKTTGFVIETSQGVYSSDSTPFAYNDVPA